MSEPKWEKTLSTSDIKYLNREMSVSIDENKFLDLLKALDAIRWTK